jgi:hypothetical protein
LTTKALIAAAPVEADQEVGGDAHALPAEEHLHQVVGGHQHQHGEGEERQIGEEARLVGLALLPVFVVVHVAHRIEVDERRDRGDDDQHDRGQPVEPDRPVGGQGARLDPAEERDLLAHAVEAQEDDPGEQADEEQERGRRPDRGGLADDPPAEAAQDGADQRRE